MNRTGVMSKFLMYCSVIVLLGQASHAKLNVFIDADEVSRFLPGEIILEITMAHDRENIHVAKDVSLCNTGRLRSFFGLI